MCPIEIPTGMTSTQAMNSIAEKFLKVQRNPSAVNPVWTAWQDDALKSIWDLMISIRKTLSAPYCNVSMKHIGGLILKHMPKTDLLSQLDYADVKEIFEYASTTWAEHSKVEYEKFRRKVRAVHVQNSEVQEAGEMYGSI